MADSLDIKYIKTSDGKPVAVSVAERDSSGNIIKDTYINKDGSSSLSSDLDLNNHKVINLSEPTNSTDATTKNYVDNKISSEASTRETGDSNTLSSAKSYAKELVDEETSERKTSDNELTTKTNQLEETIKSNFNTLNTSLSTEITNRKNADDNLNTKLSEEISARESAIFTVNSKIDTETSNRQTEDTVLSSKIDTTKENLQSQIDAITSASDVVDVVASKNDLNNYDKSKLTDKDIIKVLKDESQENKTTYYRFTKSSSSFELIGGVGPYYTQSEVDSKISDVTTAISNEKTARENKDTSLENSINTEISNRTSADNSLQTQITSNKTNITNIQTELSTKVSQTRKINNKALSSDITLSKSDIGLSNVDNTSDSSKNVNSAVKDGEGNIIVDTYAKISDIPSVPSNISSFNNDAGYITKEVSNLTNYTTTTALNTALSNKQDKLTAGTNITISGSTISAKDTTYDVATTDADGLMSSTDKQTLDTINSNYVTLDTDQTISGIKTYNAPTNITGQEQATTIYKTANGGQIMLGKEKSNNGTVIALDQVAGTRRLNFRASSINGAMIWEQPESGSILYYDVENVDFRKVSNITFSKITNASFLGTDSSGKVKSVKPATLTFTGAVSDTYDGTAAKSIEIPNSVDGMLGGTINGDVVVSGSITEDLSGISVTSNQVTYTDSNGATCVFEPEMVKVDKVGKTLGIHLIIKATFDATTDAITIPSYQTIREIVWIYLPSSIYSKITAIGNELTWVPATFGTNFIYIGNSVNNYIGVYRDDDKKALKLWCGSQKFTIYKGNPIVRCRADIFICLNDNLVS